MPKREKYIAKLECPNCDNSGSAEWEENENPVYAGSYNLSTEILSVPNGFEMINSTKIKCKNCGEIFSTRN